MIGLIPTFALFLKMSAHEESQAIGIAERRVISENMWQERKIKTSINVTHRRKRSGQMFLFEWLHSIFF